MTALTELVREAGLAGRGGGSFSTATKLELAQQHRADLIINACDGEVDARKDGWVIEHHLMDVLGAAAQLTTGRVRIAAQRDSVTIARLQAACVDTLAVPRHYVSSEESSLVRLAHGGPARPLTRYRPITAGGRSETGRRLRPTLVLNAETVWRIQQIRDHGAAWFRSHGTEREPGPRLVTMVRGVARPGVYEAAAGMTFGHLGALAGGFTAPVGAFWLGGLGGGFVAAADAPVARWSRDGLRRWGIGPGAGTIDVIRAGDDPWLTVTAALDYAAGESAGQCGPCMFGIPALFDDVAALRRSPDEEAVERLYRRLGQLPGRGACHYPDGIAGFVRSALRTFGEVPQAVPARRHRHLSVIGPQS